MTNTGNAEIAQLVEHNLAKVGVASSSLVFRSQSKNELKVFQRRVSFSARRAKRAQGFPASSLVFRSILFFNAQVAEW